MCWGPRPSTSGTNSHSIFLDTSNKHFMGAEANIGAVLGLCTEKIDKKAAFGVFQEHLSNYIITNVKNGSDVVNIVKLLETP